MLDYQQNLNNHVIFSGLPATVQIWAEQHAVPLRKLNGKYKGRLETSFIISEEYFPQLLASGVLDNEESVLLLEPKNTLSGNRNAKLLYLGSLKTEELGTFVPVDREYALAHQSYTYDPEAGQYYVCAPEL